ncbi:ATP-binding protein [Capillimicrobium parvum]|uniref:histidine kinase n=1 Tax=Capillimicrobium parvum TaxID=2884022 RepID=A0A9E7BZ56_9ACTN|nr:ATP-binding protein [Capillimicrobium parvum]UGS34137.1 Sensor histidine kinase RcsC [Capillimicrobium parvum]
MRKLSVGRSFRLVLIGLTLVLAALAGLGVARLYDARRDYEDDLSDAYSLQAAATQIKAAAIAEEATLQSTSREEAQARARRLFEDGVASARRLAADDPSSARLLSKAVAEQSALRRADGGDDSIAPRPALAELVALQRERRAKAADDASSRTRTALIVVAAFGVLAVLLALVALGAVLAALRRPIDALVDAAGRLAAGDLHVRVEDDLPGELAGVGRAFNAMAGDLERAQQALAEERERLAVTIESLGDGLLVVEDGVVVEHNPRAEELLGPLPAGTPLAGVAALPEPLEALAGEVVVESGRRTLAITASRLGYTRGLVWTVRDVSERARLERLKSEFVATASHELRSPLTSIKGFVELLRASPGLTARQREWVDIVLSSSDRLVEMVNDLLDVARVEAGRVEIHRRPTDVGAIGREVAALIGPRLQSRDQHLRLELPPDLPRAMADPARLRQVMTNLLTNAHQYTQPGGHIELRACADDHGVRIEVADDGPGMTADQTDRVFERFYRARGSAGSGQPGSGLGLAIVRSLVDLQGGAIDVVSKPGAGSTFVVSLPGVPALEPGARPAGLHGPRVLVVEDDAVAAEAIVAALEALGVDAVAVHDAPSALARLSAEHFDAMTLDVLLGHAAGFGVLRAVRDDPRLIGMPVMAVSSLSGRHGALSGEVVVDRGLDADELADALGAGVLAERVRVLVVGRPQTRAQVGAALGELGVEFEWASGADEAARRSGAGRFEVALVDAGMRDAGDAVTRLQLSGRRLRPSVVVFADGGEAPGLARLDAQPLPVEDAGAVVLGMLESRPSAEVGG